MSWANLVNRVQQWLKGSMAEDTPPVVLPDARANDLLPIAPEQPAEPKKPVAPKEPCTVTDEQIAEIKRLLDDCEEISKDLREHAESCPECLHRIFPKPRKET